MFHSVYTDSGPQVTDVLCDAVKISLKRTAALTPRSLDTRCMYTLQEVYRQYTTPGSSGKSVVKAEQGPGKKTDGNHLSSPAQTFPCTRASLMRRPYHLPHPITDT